MNLLNYLKHPRTVKQIAAHLQCTVSNVQKALAKNKRLVKKDGTKKTRGSVGPAPALYVLRGKAPRKRTRRQATRGAPEMLEPLELAKASKVTVAEINQALAEQAETSPALAEALNLQPQENAQAVLEQQEVSVTPETHTTPGEGQA